MPLSLSKSFNKRALDVSSPPLFPISYLEKERRKKKKIQFERKKKLDHSKRRDISVFSTCSLPFTLTQRQNKPRVFYNPTEREGQSSLFVHLHNWLVLPSRFLCKKKKTHIHQFRSFSTHPSQTFLSLSVTNGSQPLPLSSHHSHSPNAHVLSKALDRALLFLLGSLFKEHSE